MPSKLTQILDLVENGISARIAGVDFARGRKNLARNDKSPRVVWVRTQNVAGPARQTNPLIWSRATSIANVQCYIYATDDGAEALEHAVILAAKELGGTSAIVGNTQWFTAKDSEYGELAVLTLRFEIPVADAAQETVTIETVDFDNDTQNAFDGIIQAGEL